MVSQLDPPPVARPAGPAGPALPPGVEPEAIQRAALFQGLTLEQIARFLNAGRPRTFAAGEPIIVEGNTDTDTYVILRGKIDVVKKLPPVLPGGVEQPKSIVQLIAPAMGVFAMGAMNMLSGVGRSTSVVALEPCDTIIISKEAYEQLAARDPLFGYVITRNIALEIIKFLNDTNARVVKLTQALTLALQKRA